MKKFLLLPGFVALFFTSCTPENDKIPDKPAPGDTARLTVIVDSLFVSGELNSVDSNKFNYDQAGRLTEWASFSASDASANSQEILITRDDQGRAVSVILKYNINNGQNGPATPNLISEIHYSAGTNQASFIYEYEEGKMPSTGDSIVLAYTGEDITDTRNFDLSGATPKESYSETVYVFDNAGHLTSSIADAQDSTKPSYYTYTFDDKRNPLKLGPEALTIDVNRMSAGNLGHTHFEWPYGKMFNDDYYAYTYRSDGRPATCVYTSSSLPTFRRTSAYSYSKEP